MRDYAIAHVLHQGKDLVVVPVGPNFHRRPIDEQNRVREQLQACVQAARLRGTVVPVWEEEDGAFGFLAPPTWHAFFRSMTMADVRNNINKKITCD